MAYNDNVTEDVFAQDNLEKLLDKIADALIISPLVNSDLVQQSQKTIRRGTIQVGRDSTTDRLILFQKDIKANQEDFNSYGGTGGMMLQELANQINDFNTLSVDISEGIDNSIGISLTGGGFTDGGHDITEIIVGDGNPLNVSQFMTINQRTTNVDVKQANEFLDTNIYELLPTGDSRQSRITRLFQELNALLPPLPGTENQPSFDEYPQDGRVDRANDGTWISASLYSQNNSISYAQDNQDGNINEEDAFLHRLRDTANSTNNTSTIQDIYDTVEPYLTDILEPSTELQDMPLYENQSNGYLKFRNPNQGIIIRNTDNNFIEGLNPNNPTWKENGFTITTWVRFKDKSSQGTLFNFGNPTRDNNPFGFKLETYVINGDDVPRTSAGIFVEGFSAPEDSTWGQIFKDGNELNLTYASEPPNEGFFKQSNTERFVRLVVQDGDRLRGSHMGMPFMNRRAGLPEFPELSGGYDYYTDDNGSVPYDHAYGLMTNTKVPTNFNEWYFICASYNPNPAIEDNSHNDDDIYNNYKNNPNFWMNNINPNTGALVANSGYGNQCKVEIISRSDLLRARGFRV